MRAVMATVLGLGLACAAGARPAVQAISYETQACYGTCPVYKVTVRSDGRGTFEGRQHTAVSGTRDFRVTRAQWTEFRRRLRADRPMGRVDLTGGPRCRTFASDMPGVAVRWTGGGRPAALDVNYGCDGLGNARMFRALRSAPDALPIARFIGGR